MRTESELFVDPKYKIIFEDGFFLVVDKPSPLPVHPVGKFKEKNLLSLLVKDLGSCPGSLKIVNRLDSETSGLVIVSKTEGATGQLGKLFENREVDKEYRAVVLGRPEFGAGTISVSLGVCGRRGHNMRVPDPEGQTARTDYQVLKRSENFSYLKIIPKTGRTHQIRAHLAFLGHPIAGDKIYIDPQIFERYIREGWKEEMRVVVKAERLLLHASRLEFRHPVTAGWMTFESDPPPCFDIV